MDLESHLVSMDFIMAFIVGIQKKPVGVPFQELLIKEMSFCFLGAGHMDGVKTLTRDLHSLCKPLR